MAMVWMDIATCGYSCIWSGVRKSSEIGQGYKNSIYNFACFLTGIAKVLFLGGGLSAGLCLLPNLMFF